MKKCAIKNPDIIYLTFRFNINSIAKPQKKNQVSTRIVIKLIEAAPELRPPPN